MSDSTPTPGRYLLGTVLAPTAGKAKKTKAFVSNGPWSYPAGQLAPSAGRRRTGATVGRPSWPALTATLAA